MPIRRQLIMLAVATTALSLSLSLPVGSFAGPFRNPFRKKTSVEQLACDIDCLERHVEEYGSVVAKQPDVWGQSRLTKYRRDFEYIMSQQTSRFHETINATIRRSDQAFLASALALQAAASGA